MLVAAMLAAIAVLFVAYAVADWLRYRRMPGFGPYYPIVGHIPTLAPQQHRILDLARECWVTAGRPPVLLLKPGLLGPARYLVGDRAHVEHVLKSAFDKYAVGVGLRGNAARDLLGEGIVNADGHKWFVQRKLAMREFSVNRFRNFMSGIFQRNAVKMGATMEAEAKKAGEVVDVQQWLLVLTLDSFSEIAFGVDIGGLKGEPQPFAAAFDVCQLAAVHRGGKYNGVWPIMRALNIGPERENAKALKVIDDFIYSIMERVLEADRQKKRQQEETHGKPAVDGDDDDTNDNSSTANDEGLLQRLMPAAKRDDGTYDRKLIRDMLLSLTLGARDTTAVAMAWLLREMTRRPDILKEVRDELDAVAGPGQPLTFDNVTDCHYLQALIFEGQRLYPSIPINLKTAVEADVLPSGVNVRPGDVLMTMAYVTGVDPRVWGADADEFKPERWLQEDGTCKKPDPYEYPVFNAGPRLCLGMNMAMLEIKVVLGTFVRMFDFELAVPFESIKPAVTASLHLDGGLPMRLKRRDAKAA